MLINARFDYPTIERITRDDGVRHYTCPETGKQLPSITTIISATEDKSGLERWRERVGEAEAERIRTEAAGLGSLMHQHLENYIKGIPRPGGTNYVRKLAAAMADQIIMKGLPGVEEVWGQEVAMYFPGLFAGTTDLVGIHRGKTAIMDHKTTKKMKKRCQIDNYFDQMSAYAICHDAVYKTDIEKGVIFMADREKNYQEFIIEKNELEKHKIKFLLRFETYLENHSDR